MAAGIVGYGAYIPKFRIERSEIGKAWQGGGRGEKSVLGTDEDVITMAVEAALNAVEVARIDPTRDLGALYLASTSAPYVEHSSAGIVAEALGVRADAELADFGTTTRSSFAALKSCADSVAAGRIQYGLVIGSDSRPGAPGSAGEQNFGAAAAAVIVGPESPVASIDTSEVYSTRFMDRWRAPSDDYVRDYDQRFTREFGYIKHVKGAVQRFVEKSNVGVDAFQHVVLQYVDERLTSTVAKSLGVKPAQMARGDVGSRVGDVGAASPLLGLAAVLDTADPGDRILAVSYGSGTSDALSLMVGDGLDRRIERSCEYYLSSKESIDYVTYLKHARILEEYGEKARPLVPPVSPLLERDSEALHRLMGARCTKCGYMNIPPSLRKICVRCGNTEFEIKEIARRGKVHTFCINYYMPAPFDSPMPIIVGDLEDGTRYQALGSQMKPSEVKIDIPVELVFRTIIIDREARVYGYKYRIPRHW